MEATLQSGAVATSPAQESPSACKSTRKRKKITWNESSKSDSECAAGLASGAVVSRMEKLLLAGPFVAELEREFGLDEGAVIILAGEVMLAIAPTEFLPDAGIISRLEAVRAERSPESQVDIRASVTTFLRLDQQSRLSA